MKIILSLFAICVLFAISCDSTTEPTTKPMIYGTLVDAAGNPIADAEICLIPDIVRKFIIGKSAIMDAPKPPFIQVAELRYFTAKRVYESILLEWSTSSEQNCDRFELMRAIMKDNKPGDYTKIATVQANGTSTKTITYTFTDENLEINNTYLYKLKIYDNNGSSVETPDYKKVVYNESLPELIGNFPNPFIISTAFYYSLPKSYDFNFNIVEKSTGIKYVDLNMHSSSGSYMYRWLALLDTANNDSTNLRPGIYTATLTTIDTNISINMVLDFIFDESNCKIPLHIVKTDKNGKFEIDWKWFPVLAEYPRLAHDGTQLGNILLGNSGEIIARKFVSENDNQKKYLIGRHSVIAKRKSELKIKLSAKEVEVQK